MTLAFVFMCLSDLEQSWTSLNSVQFTSPPPGSALFGLFFVSVCFCCFHIFWNKPKNVDLMVQVLGDKNIVKYSHDKFEIDYCLSCKAILLIIHDII